MAAANLDVLVFPELGMHLQTFLLAFGRYAPVQVTSHGNSVRAAISPCGDTNTVSNLRSGVQLTLVAAATDYVGFEEQH